MKQTTVETVVEPMGKVPAGASCFVERDGASLIVKVWLRGRLTEVRRLRSTGLPVGRYRVEDGVVVHRYDPATLLVELERHQQRVRMQSPELVAAVKRIAKQLGGRLEPWDDDDGELLGYRVEPRRGGFAAGKLERSRRELASESAIVFRTGPGDSAIGISIASRDLDLIPRICSRWDDDVGSLIGKLDAECGAHLEMLDLDLIALRLDRKPKRPAAIARIMGKLARETELEFESYADVERELARRQLWLWWD